MALKPSRKVVFLPRRAKRERHARWQSAYAGLDVRIAELERRFGALRNDASAFPITRSIRAALLVSLALHLAIIFGVGFKVPEAPRPEKAEQSLEVVLVNAKSKTKPVVADALAQHNLDGGGNTDEKRRAKTPLPALPKQRADADVKLALRRVEQLEREARQVMTQAKAKAKPEVESAPPSKPAPVAEVKSEPSPSASEIMQKSMEIARLEARISKSWDAYQQRPRRRFIGSRTQETRFARYVDDWRQKIERVGDLNYPQGARDQRLYGSLLVTVAIRADGTVEQVDINRSSGHKILDDGARRIVALAGPFAPFPQNIAKDVDILHITRTWTFTTGDRFLSE